MGRSRGLTAKRKFTGGPGPDDASAAPVAPTGLGAEAAANAKLPLGISTAETRKEARNWPRPSPLWLPRR